VPEKKMETQKLLNLARLYLDSSGEDINFISEELEEAGIDSETSEGKALELIRKSKAELKIQKGGKFKEEFYKKCDELKGSLQGEEIDAGLAVAFRKLEENESGDMLDDKEKMLIMEYLRKKNRKKE
jgi:hypothetical protein